VAEAAVRVAIATQSLDDRPGRPVGEEHAVAVAIHQAGGGPDEVLGGAVIDWHAPHATRQCGCAVFEKSDRRDASEARHLGSHVRLIGVAGIERQLDSHSALAYAR
jgi:hypothetical protein